MKSKEQNHSLQTKPLEGKEQVSMLLSDAFSVERDKTADKEPDKATNKPTGSQTTNEINKFLIDGKPATKEGLRKLFETTNEEIIEKAFEWMFPHTSRDIKNEKQVNFMPSVSPYEVKEFCRKALSLKDEEIPHSELIEEIRIKEEQIEYLKKEIKKFMQARDLLNERIEKLQKEIEDDNEFCLKCGREQKQKEKDFLKDLKEEFKHMADWVNITINTLAKKHGIGGGE